VSRTTLAVPSAVNLFIAVDVLYAISSTGEHEFSSGPWPDNGVALIEVPPGSWSILALADDATTCDQTPFDDVLEGQTTYYAVSELPGTFDLDSFVCTMP
jgi:hypothetical protein